MTLQVAPVNKALGSVHQMVRRGNKVTFDTDESGRDVSSIVHEANGQHIPLRVENGVYVLDMLVASPNEGVIGPEQRYVLLLLDHCCVSALMAAPWARRSHTSPVGMLG